jgi:P4 family phage/plasmid primase-like protien
MTNVAGLNRALASIGRGFYVFPARVETLPDGRKDVTPIKDWRRAGTLDPERVRSWWTDGSWWADAWPCIDCGRSGIVVVDLDPPDGMANWAALGAPAYPHATVQTPRGGRHLVYKADPGHHIGTDSSGKVAAGVDIKGNGGFVFNHGWVARLRDLPPVPAVVRERMAATNGRPAWIVPEVADSFDTAGRSFTGAQARAFYEPALAGLAGAKVGTIQSTANEAACVLSHFVPEFLSADEAYGLLCTALSATAYDGATWKAHRFVSILDGSERITDPWKAHRVDETQAEGIEVVGPEPEPDGEVKPEKEKKPSSAFFTDAKLAETLGVQALARRFIWTAGQGWFVWTGTVWRVCDESVPREALRRAVVAAYDRELRRMGKDPDRGPELLDQWRKVLSAAKIGAIMLLARGIAGVRMDDAALDADPDLLNTPSGVVDLRTGEVTSHEPGRLMTKITSGSYRPGWEHGDWTTALEALGEDTRAWFQVRIGQAATGRPWPHGDVVILQGGGSNGKSAVTTDGVVPALGDYASVASTKLLQAGEHSTERAELRGRRLLIAEELTEGRSIDVTALKQIQDVGMITARRLYRENVTFSTSHSLFVTTNYVPVVNETDHGTWRRLTLLRFRTRFLRPGEPVLGPQDRTGDPGLKERLKAGTDGRHDAIVTWAVEGARRWYANRPLAAMRPPSVELDTMTWRLDADRVLRYVSERLVRDHRACVLRSELIEDFNDWLAALGHSPWSASTFRDRFGQHEQVLAWSLQSGQARDLEHLSRRFLGREAPSVTVARVWRGCRFRTEEDGPVENGR